MRSETISKLEQCVAQALSAATASSSGEPVPEGVEEAAQETELAPAGYYQLETKALKAMLVALTPGLGSSTGEPTTLLKQLTGELLKGQTKARKREPSAKKKTSSDPDESEIAAPMS